MNPGYGYQNSMNAALEPEGMQAPGQDWTTMLMSFLSGAGTGISGGLGAGAVSGGKQEAREMRRRTMTGNLRKGIGREHAVQDMQRKSSNYDQDLQNELMQEMAKGFAQALTGR